jgi:hypothetical protein
MTEMKWEVHHLTETALGRSHGVGGLIAGWYGKN